jgi:gliding motility-associated-like protein
MKKPSFMKWMLFFTGILFLLPKATYSQCSITTSSDTTICYGTVATLQASGAHTYSWSNGFIGNTVMVSPLSTTTYSVIGTDTVLMCSDTSYITVTVNDLPFVNFTFTPSTSVCQGTMVTLFGNGANTYTWTGGIVNGGSFMPMASNTYTVTGTDGNGCSNTAQVTVTVKPLPNVNPSSPVSICAGQSAMLSSTGAHIYTWNPGSLSGTPVVVSPASTTTYTVTGTNIITGCSNTASTTVTVNPLPNVNYIANPGTVLCAGDSLRLNGTGANSYMWTGGISNGITFLPLASSTYTVTGTSAAGCTNTATANITVNPLPVVGYILVPNDTVCSGTNVNLSGTGANSYSWTGGITNGINFVPASSASYTVTGTNLSGCSNTATANITVNPLPVISVTPGGSFCVADTVILSASGADSYVWMPGSISGSGITVNPLATTTYTVTGTIMSTGCTATASTTITINPIPNVSYTILPNDTVCLGTSVSLSGTGANTYTWTGGITNAVSFVPASGGTYTITGTDINGCSNTATANLVVNPLPIVSFSVLPNDTICLGSSIILSGTGASSYSWTGGVVDATPFSPASGSSYMVTGTDINGCTNTATANIVVNPLPTVSYTISPNDTVCSGTSVTLTGSGANSYSWTGGISNGISFTPFATSNYIVTGTDLNGCTNTATAIVNVITAPNVGIISSPGSSICIGSSVSLSGTGATSYSWNNGVVDGVNFTPATTNTYTVIGTNGTGCIDSASITVTVNPIPAISFTIAPNDTICNGSPVSLTGVGTGSFAWSGGVVNGISFTPSATNSYTVTLTDLNGCTNTSTANIYVNSLPVVTASSNSPVCFGSSIQLSSTGGTSFSWTGPATYSSILQNNTIPFSSLLNGGNYIVSSTDPFGCSNSDTVTVSVIVPPSGLITASPSVNLCLGDTVILSSSVGSSSYLWDTGATSSSITVNPIVNTTYALTMINPPFCNGIVQDFITVNVYSQPTATIVATTDTVCSGAGVSLMANGGVGYSWNTGSLSDSIFVTPFIDSTFSVIVSSAFGCLDTASISITALSNPVPPVITTSSNVICNNGTTQIFSSIPNGINWNPSSSTNDTLIVSTPGTYTVTYSDLNGCTSTSTVVITQNFVNASISGDTINCPGLPSTLIASGGIGFSWSTSDTTSIINVQPVLPSYYSVMVTDVAGCSSFDSIMVYPFALLNMDPKAVLDTLTMIQNTYGYVNITNNDTNYSSISIITLPSNGTFNLNLSTIEYIPQPGFVGTDSLQYMICSSLCSQTCDTAWLLITVQPTATVVISQVITPNGDNFNDTWNITNLNLFPDNEVILMNRWGDVVYQAKPYNNDWSGQSNAGIQMFGNTLSTGTYFYIVKLGGDKEPVKGFLELIK